MEVSSQGRRGSRVSQIKRSARPKPTLLRPVQSKRLDYIFFSSHILVVAFHVPPAFAQSASVFAAVTSPAKAGPVKASARANAKIESRVFMAFTPLRWRSPARNRASQGFFELSPMGRGLHFTSIMARDHATKGSQLSPQGCSGRRTRTRYPEAGLVLRGSLCLKT